jgi:hypothetical protein
MDIGTILAIELGDFSLGVATLVDVAWFLAGVLALTGLTGIVMRWNRHAHPDPFAIDRDFVDLDQ